MKVDSQVVKPVVEEPVVEEPVVEEPVVEEPVIEQVVEKPVVEKTVFEKTVVEELVRLLINQQRFKDAQNILTQLSKPNMELPSHLIRQKEFVEQLLNDKKLEKTPTQS